VALREAAWGRSSWQPDPTQWSCGCSSSRRCGSGKGGVAMVSSRSSSSGRLELLLGSSTGAGAGLTGLTKGNESRCWTRWIVCGQREQVLDLLD
jgi:hypothetical protein